MRPKSIFLLSLALGCGLIASIGINQVMANRRAGANATGGETTPIFVAQHDIGIGDPLEPEMLKLEEWPVEKVPPGAIGKLENIEGRRCRQMIFGGEPIMEAKLLAPGEKGQSPTELIPPGMRVVPIQVDAVSSAAGMIQVGDRVDVLVHVSENASRGILQSLTRTFLQRIKVFAVDDVFNRAKDGETTVTAKTISLLVTPDQAQMVMLATQIGKLQLVMRSASDEEDAKTKTATLQELLTGRVDPEATTKHGGHADFLKLLERGQADEQASAAPPAEPEPEPTPFHRMVVISGTEVKELTFADEGRPPSGTRAIVGSDTPSPRVRARRADESTPSDAETGPAGLTPGDEDGTTGDSSSEPSGSTAGDEANGTAPPGEPTETTVDNPASEARTGDEPGESTPEVESNPPANDTPRNGETE